MIGRNHLVEIKRIKELTLSFFPSPHHALLPPMPSPPTESWFAIRIKGSFATQSRQKRTLRDPLFDRDGGCRVTPAHSPRLSSSTKRLSSSTKWPRTEGHL